VSRPENTPRGAPARVAPPRRKADAGTDAPQGGLRRLPAQARGQVTFERLLATAANLLETEGIEGLTTNRIAAEARINIASLYKYFSNKHAILTALFERHNEQRLLAVRGLMEELGQSADWPRVIDRTIDKLAQARRSTPGSMALRRAMRSSPELADIDQQANAAASVWVGEQVRQLTGLPARRAQCVARMLIETEVALLDWWETPEVDRNAEVLREAKALLKAYLGLYAPAVSGDPA
jgi:AcrR family transcriptional regulator